MHPFTTRHFERRRLRLMNALAVALARQGCSPKISRKKDPTGFGYKVGCESLGLNIDEPDYSRWGWRSEPDLAKPASTTLQVSIYPNVAGIQTSWKDKGDDKVENRVTQIVTMAIVAGELAYRQSAVSAHDRLVSLKAYRIEEARRAKEERERKERERLEAERKARIEGLLGAAAKHRQANDIREYVAAVRNGNVSADPADIERWAAWALAQADDLDPLRSFSVESKS